MPKVSILMAHGGSPRFLATACRAIDAQEYRDFELIVVDDGAALNWDAALGRLRCPWRVLTNSTRRGLAHSLNRAANAATGSLLARMDSDDDCLPSRLKRQVSFMDSQPHVAFLGSAVYWLDERQRELGRNFPLTDPTDLVVGLSTYNQICHGSTVMRREAFEGLCGYDESTTMAQDYELWLRALSAGHAFANLPEALYGHRLHAGSISSRAALTQSHIAAQLRMREATADRSARVAAWFAAGGHRERGRPHESLQLGRLGLLFLASLSSRSLEPSLHRSVLRFSARHAVDTFDLLSREVGWRHSTAAKVLNLLR